MTDGAASSLLVFADDWGRHPSSCQHLVGQLLGKYPVCWVNTIGTRRPRFDLATLKRGWEKVRHWTRGARGPCSLPANLRVLTPKMWPWFRSRLDRKLNRELLFRQLAPVVRSLPPPVVALTVLPIVADLVGLLPVSRWVYYCVDDFAEWPGLDRTALEQMDEDLIRRADSLIAVSETLAQKMARHGKKAALLTHGVDLDFWNPATPSRRTDWQSVLHDRGEGVASLPQLGGLERPLVVFWGVIDQRMDLAFVERLAGDLTRGTIVLVGPAAAPDARLFALNRVVRLLPIPYDSLPHLAQAADVLVMPYADLPVTRAMQPLKLKEYLATGRPAVVRDLPATRGWADCADLADTPQSFSHAVRLRLESGLPESQKRARLRLAQETWAHKAACLESWAFNWKGELSLDAVTCA